VLAADLADFAAACALPLPGSSIEPRQAISRNDQPGSHDALNTQSIQKTAAYSPEDRAMLERGNRLLAGGDIVAARLMFRYLANHRGLADAYAGLAKSYDPAYLDRQNVLGVSGDPAKADEFYLKAEKLGAVRSQIDNIGLSRINGRCDDSLCKLVNSTGGPTVVCDHTAEARVSRIR
jgi:hypothetical protein